MPWRSILAMRGTGLVRRVPGVTALACEAKSRAALPPAEMKPPPGAAMDPSRSPALATPRSVSHCFFRSTYSLSSTNGKSRPFLPSAHQHAHSEVNGHGVIQRRPF